MAFTQRSTCRIDDGELLELFDLGSLYVSAFPKLGEKPPVPKVPLTLCIGKTSGLVQLKHTAHASVMYEEYWYRSGMNATMTEELRSISLLAQKLMPLKEEDIVVDIGCNDGTLIKNYPKTIVRIGFDPARNLEKYSSQHTSKTIIDYFSAQRYFKQCTKKARIITSIAMFYDLEDPNTFVQDIAKVLDDEGLWVIQMSYLPLMLKQMAFDNICHEHLEYYSLTSLNYLLERNGMKVVDCQLNDMNGGSFRILIRKKKAKPEHFATTHYRDVAQYRVEGLLAYEKEQRLDDPATYHDFFSKMKKLRSEATSFLSKEKKNGKSIWGYGASTKGNTLLQWYGLDNKIIDKIAEKNEDKFGRMTIGTNIPIVPEREILEARPDYLIVLPWHFRQEFLIREREYLKKGGKFIFPLPAFEVVGIEDL